MASGEHSHKKFPEIREIYKYGVDVALGLCIFTAAVLYAQGKQKEHRALAPSSVIYNKKFSANHYSAPFPIIGDAFAERPRRTTPIPHPTETPAVPTFTVFTSQSRKK